MPPDLYTCQKCNNKTADYTGSCYYCRSKMGKFEGIFYDYNYTMIAWGIEDRDRACLLYNLFNILNDGSFRYKWIAEVTRTKVAAMIRESNNKDADWFADRLFEDSE